MCSPMLLPEPTVTYCFVPSGPATTLRVQWLSGQPGIARQLVRHGVPARLRGLIELYGGDQATAYEFLARGTTPDLLVMGIDAAINAVNIDGAVALGRRVARFPGYDRYGRWFAAMARDTPRPDTPSKSWARHPTSYLTRPRLQMRHPHRT
jgi:hypothetical protein